MHMSIATSMIQTSSTVYLHVLATKASKYNANNPNWDIMVIGGPFEAEYLSVI